MEVDREKLERILDIVTDQDMHNGILCGSTFDVKSEEACILEEILGQQAYQESWNRARAKFPPGTPSDVWSYFVVNTENKHGND